MSTDIITRFRGGMVPRGASLVEEDVWRRGGKIIDPHALFFKDKKSPDKMVDCSNCIVAPGFMDIQINGGFGVDFSSLAPGGVVDAMETVSRGLLQHGVTSFCPTIVTSPPEYYEQVLPEIKCRKGGRHGATILGVHLEGPFINPQKRGAHSEPLIITHISPSALQNCYHSLDNVRIVTLAPELPGAVNAIQWLHMKRRVVVAIGHSMATLDIAEESVGAGASLITHLFNAMLPFHHRDPGIVGLLTSRAIGEAPIYYGLIADGNHTDVTVQRIAYKSNPTGVVLVTDAMAAMGLSGCRFSLGQREVEVTDGTARVAGTDTLAGSIATMDHCLRQFHQATCCTTSEALQAASLHPAQALGLQERKGTLDYGSDADLVVLDRELNVQATVIAGEVVWTQPGTSLHRQCHPP